MENYLFGSVHEVKTHYKIKWSIWFSFTVVDELAVKNKPHSVGLMPGCKMFPVSVCLLLSLLCTFRCVAYKIAIRFMVWETVLQMGYCFLTIWHI